MLLQSTKTETKSKNKRHKTYGTGKKRVGSEIVEGVDRSAHWIGDVCGDVFGSDKAEYRANQYSKEQEAVQYQDLQHLKTPFKLILSNFL